MSITSLQDQLKEVRRELAMRRNAYPRFVAKGTLKQEQADIQVRRLEAVVDTLEHLTAMQDAVMANIPDPSIPPSGAGWTCPRCGVRHPDQSRDRDSTLDSNKPARPVQFLKG